MRKTQRDGWPVHSPVGGRRIAVCLRMLTWERNTILILQIRRQSPSDTTSRAAKIHNECVEVEGPQSAMALSNAKRSFTTVLFLLIFAYNTCHAFVPSTRRTLTPKYHGAPLSPTKLKMSLDLVTYLRTEWVSAALCTNQTPRSADVVLQLGCEDGRAITFIPRTVRELITSSNQADGQVPVGAKRQLKQQQQRRQAATVTYVDQRADELTETADESVDVVISLQSAAKMLENGLDWKKSVREAARVLKPGGRLLFVEQTELEGESYLDYVDNLYTLTGESEDVKEGQVEPFPVFEEVGYDDVDLVIVPHVAGVAIKSEDAGLTPKEREQKLANEEKDRLADLSLTAYERGIKKKRKRKKKKGVKQGQEEDTTANA